MNRVGTSGGLELNSHDGNVTLDVIPLGYWNPDLSDVVAVVGSGHASWKKWNRGGQNGVVPNTMTVPPGFIGLFAQDIKARIYLRFLYMKDIDPVEALYRLEEAEYDQIPPELIASIYLAIKDVHPPTSIYPTLMGWIKDMHSASKRETKKDRRMYRLNRKQIDQNVADTIEDARKNWISPILTVDVCRYHLALIDKLWQENTLLYFAYQLIHAKTAAIKELHDTAWLKTKIAPGFAIQLPGRSERYPVPVVEPGYASPWMEVIHMVSEDVTDRAIRFIRGFSVTTESYKTIDLPIAENKELTNQICGSTQALLREAQEKQHFVADGEFIIDLPVALTPWRDAGLDALGISASKTGLWIVPLTKERNRGAVMFWPADPKRQFSSSTKVAYISLTCAAIWRDMLVQGDTVIIDKDKRHNDGAPVHREQAKARHANESPVVTLPRKHIIIQGRRVWGDKQDQEIIESQRRGPRPHTRHLPEGWRVSQNAKEIAEGYGVVLPDGYTFVHSRDVTSNGNQARPIRAKCKGLATLVLCTTL